MPQAVAAAAAWVGSAVGTAAGATLTAAGVAGATALPLAVVAANAAFLVSEIAIYVGLQGLINDIANEKSAPQGYELNLRNAADVPREMIIGQRPVAGSVTARYSWGPNLYNANFIYQLADHPCVELSRVYGDGRLVRSTPLTHGVRTEITAYSYSGGPRVWMTWHDGRPGQTADADLITKSASDPDVVAGIYGGWTTDHRGAGCAYVHVEVQFDSDILTSIPEFLFDVKGARLYDRRKDTTAGGSGSHRHDDPSTWEWSANAAVALDHYMLGYQVEDDPLAFGVGLSPIELPYETFAALADLSDEDVVTGEGAGEVTMKRFEAHAIVSSAVGFEDTIESFANQMCAKVVDLGGQIGVLGAEERTPVVSLTDDDWASDESVRYAPKLAFSDLYGAVLGSFPDPENLWQATPYPRQETSYLLLPDGGEAPTAQLDLPFETNKRRAVRLAAAWLKRESLQPRLAGTFATRSNAWRMAPGDWFTFSSVRLGITDETFEVVDTVRHDDFTVTMTARAINPDFVAFPVDADPDLGEPPALDPYDLLLTPPTFTPTATTIVGGGATEPVISVVVDALNPVTRELVIEAQEWDGSALTGPVLFFVGHADNSTSILRQGLKPGTAYKVRIKVRAGARESAWSDWSSVITTSSTYIVPLAGGASGDLSDLLDDIDSDIAAADARLDDAEDALDLQGTAIGSLETITDGQATLITGLQAKTTINANLLPNSTGAGGLEGWTNPGDWQVYEHPLWGSWFNRLFTGAATFTEYFYNSDEIEVSASTQYTVSFSPFLSGLDGGSVVFYVVYYNSGGDYVGEGGNLSLTADSTSGDRYSATFTTGATTAKVRFAVAMVNAVGDPTYAHVGFWQAKIERGATATVWSDDGTLQEARARITTVETVASDNESAIATLDSRLDAAETDIDGVQSTASNLSTRMAAVDGGSASAQTLAQIKAEVQGGLGSGINMMPNSSWAGLFSATGEVLSTFPSPIDSYFESDPNNRFSAFSIGSSFLGFAKVEGFGGICIQQAEDATYGGSHYGGFLSERITSVAGQRYMASAFTWGGMSSMYLLFRDAAGSSLGTGSNAASSSPTTQTGGDTLAEWNRWTAAADAPSGTATVEAVIYALGQPGAGTHYSGLMGWMLEELRSGQTTPSPWAPGRNDANYADVVDHSARITTVETVASDNESAIAVIDSRMDAAESDIDGVQSTASNLSSRMAAVDGGSASATSIAQIVARTFNPKPNLVPDGGLTGGAEGWTLGDYDHIRYDDDEGDMVYVTGAGTHYATSPAFPVVQGQPYSVRFRAAGDGITAGSTAVYIQWCDASGVGLSYSSGRTINNAAGFENFVLENQTAPGGSVGKARMFLQTVIPTSGTAWFGRFKCNHGPEATAFSDETTFVEASARITEAESVNSDQDSAIAVIDSRMDAAESDIDGVQSTASNLSSRMAAVDGGSAVSKTQATLEAELVAKTNPGQNLMPYPSGLGDNALASTIGWNVFSAPTPTQALYMPFYAPAGGAFYYSYWASGYTSAGYAYIVYEFPDGAVAGQTYTLSLRGDTNLTSPVFYLGARNASHVDISGSAASALSSARSSVTFTAPATTAYLTMIIEIPPQDSAGGYREISFRDIKLEVGSAATVFTDDYAAANTRASVNVIQAALAAPDGSTALIAMEADADGVVTGFKIISSNGHSTPISLIEFTAALASFTGDVIVAGSITADRIETDGITEFDVVTTTASLTFDGSNSYTWVDLVTAAGVVVPADTKVELSFSFLIGWAGTSGAGEIQLRLRRGSTTIESWTDISALDVDSPGSRQTNSMSSFEIDEPGAGTYTYTLQIMLDELGAVDPLCYIREGKFVIKQFYR